MGKNEHKVQVLMNGYRYVASELNMNITISRDGSDVGKARWKDEQLILSTALVPDDVVAALEKKLKEAMDAHWWED